MLLSRGADEVCRVGARLDHGLEQREPRLTTPREERVEREARVARRRRRGTTQTTDAPLHAVEGVVRAGLERVDHVVNALFAHGPREHVEYIELDEPPRPPTTQLDLDGPAALRGARKAAWELPPPCRLGRRGLRLG